MFKSLKPNQFFLITCRVKKDGFGEERRNKRKYHEKNTTLKSNSPSAPPHIHFEVKKKPPLPSLTLL